MSEMISTEEAAELEAFLRLVGEVVERAVRREIEHFERTHLGTYAHVPTNPQGDPDHE